MTLVEILENDNIGSSRELINENFSHLDNQKEPLITPATNQDYFRGDKTFQNLAYAVVNTVISGLGAFVNTVISASDTILQALAKLQGQINSKANDSDVVKLTGNQTIGGDKTFSNKVDANGVIVGAPILSSNTSGKPYIANKTDSPSGSMVVQLGGSSAVFSMINNTWSAELLGMSNTGTLTVNGQNWTGAWTSYTPTVSGSSGTVTSYSKQVGRYKKIGKTVFFEVEIIVSNKGSLTGPVYYTLPSTANSSIGELLLMGGVYTPGGIINKGIPTTYNDPRGYFMTGLGATVLQRSAYTNGDIINIKGSYTEA